VDTSEGKFNLSVKSSKGKFIVKMIGEEGEGATPKQAGKRVYRVELLNLDMEQQKNLKYLLSNGDVTAKSGGDRIVLTSGKHQFTLEKASGGRAVSRKRGSSSVQKSQSK